MVDLLELYKTIWENQFIDTKDLADIFKVPTSEIYNNCKELSRKLLISGDEQQHSHFGKGVTSTSGSVTRNREASLLWSLLSVDVSWDEALSNFNKAFPEYTSKNVGDKINYELLSETIDVKLREKGFEFVKKYGESPKYLDLWQYLHIDDENYLLNLGFLININEVSSKYFYLTLGHTCNFKYDFNEPFEHVYRTYMFTIAKSRSDYNYKYFDEYFGKFIELTVETFDKYAQLSLSQYFERNFIKFRKMSNNVFERLEFIKRQFMSW